MYYIHASEIRILFCTRRYIYISMPNGVRTHVLVIVDW